MEGGRPQAFGVLIELGTDIGPLPWQLDVVDHDPVVQPGARDEQRALVASSDVVERISCGDPELGDRELDVGIDDVDEVVTYLGLLGGRRLGGADVHPAVDLHRVDGHDLDADDAGGQPPSPPPTCRTPWDRAPRRTGGRRPDVTARRPGSAACDSVRPRRRRASRAGGVARRG